MFSPTMGLCIGTIHCSLLFGGVGVKRTNLGSLNLTDTVIFIRNVTD